MKKQYKRLKLALKAFYQILSGKPYFYTDDKLYSTEGFKASELLNTAVWIEEKVENALGQHSVSEQVKQIINQN